MGPEGACNIVFRREIAAAEDQAAARAAKVAEYRERFASPLLAAGRGYVDEILDPPATRAWLIAGFRSLAGKREERPQKKHGNLPV